MKKLILLLFIPLVLGCGSLDLYKDYGTVKGWGYKEMPPSQVTTSGATFYTIKLSDKSYSVGGLVLDGDAEFYYNSLMQDLGWTRKGDEFEGYYTTSVKRGRLYFHLERGVAIYFYPVSTFNVFKVTLDTPTEED
tara:strand:+ start:8 stop:412 length:405 start_codon:yes stop_codon:yes gene_type:complete